MPNNISINLVDNSQKTIKELHSAIQAGLEKCGLAAEAYAKLELSKPKKHKDGTIRPTVDTGRLRGSITYATKMSHGKGQSPAEGSDYAPHGTPDDNEVYIGTNVEYAPYVEMGTSKMPAYPFLRPAAENHWEEYKNIIKAALKGQGS